MKITVNGEPKEISADSHVLTLLGELGLTGPVAVERNGQVVPRAEHKSEKLAPDDVIEVVHFVGGG